MANFFKEYHAAIRAKRATEQAAQAVTVDVEKLSVGTIVYINPIYDENRNGKRFFVSDIGNNYVLLAETIKDALNVYGYIYSTFDIMEVKR